MRLIRLSDQLCAVLRMGLDLIARLAIIVVGLAIVGMLFTSHARGAEPALSLFPTMSAAQPVCLFAPAPVCAGPCNLFSIHQPVSACAPVNSITLFELCPTPAVVEQPEEKPVEIDQVALGPLRAIEKGIPFVYIYCPNFCRVCPPMMKEIGRGDKRVLAIFVKGNERTFPADVQAYGNANMWPVLHWNSPSGKGAMFHGRHTLDQLAARVRTEPGEDLPEPPAIKSPISALVKQ